MITRSCLIVVVCCSVDKWLIDNHHAHHKDQCAQMLQASKQSCFPALCFIDMISIIMDHLKLREEQRLSGPISADRKQTPQPLMLSVRDARISHLIYNLVS